MESTLPEANVKAKEADMAEGKSKRGLASADKKTREEVARKGGKASRGGGRRPRSAE